MSYDATNTYATAEQVRKRLTTHGSLHATNKDWLDGEQDSGELAYLEESIEYANVLIDEAICGYVDIAPRPANDWLKDRCVDIACYRVQTLGGTEADAVFAAAYELAVDKLEDVRLGTLKVPGLELDDLTNGRRGTLPMAAVNICRRGRV